MTLNVCYVLRSASVRPSSIFDNPCVNYSVLMLIRFHLLILNCRVSRAFKLYKIWAKSNNSRRGHKTIVAADTVCFIVQISCWGEGWARSLDQLIKLHLRPNEKGKTERKKERNRKRGNWEPQPRHSFSADDAMLTVPDYNVFCCRYFTVRCDLDLWPCDFDLWPWTSAVYRL